jgi:flagellin
LASGGTGTVASGGSVTLRLTGSLGTEDIVLASGADVGDLASSVNLLRGSTGIYASGSYIYSEGFGSAIRISLEQVGGTGTFTGAGGVIAGIGDKVTASGSDAVANIDGAEFSADGNILTVTSTMFVGSIELEPNFGVPGDYPQTFQFTVENSGLLFQLNTEETVSDQHIIGLPNVTTAFLGTEESTIGGKTIGGFLNSIRAGGDNDLFNNPGNALGIIDAAISDISNVRAYLGAFVNDTIDPNIASLNIAIENLVASESEIRSGGYKRACADQPDTAGRAEAAAIMPRPMRKKSAEGFLV